MASALPGASAEMDSNKWRIIVRQGATDQFERLATQFAGDPNTTVKFDRRVGPRRTGKQNRAAERRREERRNLEDPRLLIDGWFMVKAQPRGSPDPDGTED